MKVRDVGEKNVTDESKNAVMKINLANSMTDIAYNYVKKDCVFRITTEEGKPIIDFIIYFLIFIYLFIYFIYLFKFN